MEMKEEKENRTYYQNTFNEVHASENLLRKVEMMNSKNGKNAFKRTLKKSWAAAAALAFIFVSSNMITYAATGNPWITYAATGNPWVFHITLPDGSLGVVTVNGYEDENSTSDSGSEYTLSYEQAGVDAASQNSTEVASPTPSENDIADDSFLETDGEKVYLNVNHLRVADVTEDIKDGSCRGTFQSNGENYIYQITGTVEEPSIDIILFEFNN